jgi:hypothetical protein
VIKFVSDLRQVSSINKTDRHDITEILLKVALNSINQTKPKTYKLSWLHKLLEPLHFHHSLGQFVGCVIYKNVGNHSLYLSKEDLEIIEEKVNSFWKELKKQLFRVKRRN